MLRTGSFEDKCSVAEAGGFWAVIGEVVVLAGGVFSI